MTDRPNGPQQQTPKQARQADRRAAEAARAEAGRDAVREATTGRDTEGRPPGATAVTAAQAQGQTQPQAPASYPPPPPGQSPAAGQPPRPGQPPAPGQPTAAGQPTATGQPAAQDRRPDGQPPAPPSAEEGGRHQQSPAALLGEKDLEVLNRRWQDIQGAFVDSPEQAVQDADALVSDVLDRLTQLFAAERGRLESHWNRGEQVTTEDLRVALQRYRSFFQRLLTVRY